jgi:heat-inducible transcriptional repressor
VGVRKVELSPRDEQILRAIVESHVRSAKPVSSSAVLARAALKVSSATVRNAMRLLEDAGLIAQPHTSAGRVPTDLGYRYYVDHLIEPASPSERERSEIALALSSLAGLGLAAVVDGVSKLMSERSRELTVSVAPADDAVVMAGVELAALSDGRMLAATTSRTGFTRSVVLDLKPGLDVTGLPEAARLLNQWLGGARLADAEAILRRRVPGVPDPPRELLRVVLEGGARLFRTAGLERVHHEGARYIFRHPEFSSNAAALGRIFDSEDVLADVLRRSSGRYRVSVTIGRENSLKEMQGMSLVVGSFRIGGSHGRMGIIGPTRMRYPKLIGLVDYFAGMLDEILARGAQRD